MTETVRRVLGVLLISLLVCGIGTWLRISNDPGFGPAPMSYELGATLSTVGGMVSLVLIVWVAATLIRGRGSDAD